MTDEALGNARAAAGARRWSDALEGYQAIGPATLHPDDLERLAIAAVMLARIDVCADAWARAYSATIDDDPRRAARCALTLGMVFMNAGETAQGGGWIGRAAQALERAPAECPERGMLMMPMGLQQLAAGDAEAALKIFTAAAAIGARFRDADLLTLSGMGTGRALIALGRIEDGLAALDRAMVGVTANEVSPLVAGIAYCAVVQACTDAFDVRRASEWTTALHAWSGPQQDLASFRGECLVYRSELMQLRGAWPDAMEEARRARARLSEPMQPAVGMAFYQLGELHRVQGALKEAEPAYREAHRHGHPPHPGLALLQLARGDASGALASIATALQEAPTTGRRCRLLAAKVEIALEAGDLDAARAAAADLDAMRAEYGPPLLRAMCAQARGAVHHATGDHAEAMATLREALRIWQELDVPYEAARTRVLIARACAALGDRGTADLERDVARAAFEKLGAAPALAALNARAAAAPGGLTPREVDILRSVATGKTNKAIAADLVISEKTVARHLSNIFTKLGFATRAEATAYAIKHGLA